MNGPKVAVDNLNPRVELVQGLWRWQRGRDAGQIGASTATSWDGSHDMHFAVTACCLWCPKDDHWQRSKICCVECEITSLSAGCYSQPAMGAVSSGRLRQVVEARLTPAVGMTKIGKTSHNSSLFGVARLLNPFTIFCAWRHMWLEYFSGPGRISFLLVHCFYKFYSLYMCSIFTYFSGGVAATMPYRPRQA